MTIHKLRALTVADSFELITLECDAADTDAKADVDMRDMLKAC